MKKIVLSLALLALASNGFAQELSSKLAVTFTETDKVILSKTEVSTDPVTGKSTEVMTKKITLKFKQPLTTEQIDVLSEIYLNNMQEIQLSAGSIELTEKFNP